MDISKNQWRSTGGYSAWPGFTRNVRRIKQDFKSNCKKKKSSCDELYFLPGMNLIFLPAVTWKIDYISQTTYFKLGKMSSSAKKCQKSSAHQVICWVCETYFLTWHRNRTYLHFDKLQELYKYVICTRMYRLL